MKSKTGKSKSGHNLGFPRKQGFPKSNAILSKLEDFQASKLDKITKLTDSSINLVPTINRIVSTIISTMYLEPN